MILNDASADKCVACENPRPGSKPVPAAATEAKSTFSFGEGGGFKFGGGSQSTPDPKPVTDAPIVDDLFAKFKKAASGKWTCDVCMILNDASADKCVACENPRPGSKPVPAAATEAKSTFSFGEGGGFKFGGGSQSTSSSSLSGFKFGSTEPSKPVEKSDGFKFGSSETDKVVGGFKFGSSEPSKPIEQGNGFKFGSCETPKSAEKKEGFKLGSTSPTEPVSDGFQFGSSEPSKPVEKENGFKFGSFEAPKSAEKTEGFKLISTTTTEPVSGFKFGTDSPNPVKQSQVFKSAAGGFQFSSSENGVKLAMEATDTPKTKSKKGEYLANLKALNTQVTNWIKSHVDENPLVDLTPVFKDYDKHITELRSKFNVQASIKPVENVTNPEEKEEAKKHDEPKPFSFGINQSGFGALSSGFGSNASSFQFGFLKKDENKAEEVKSDEEEETSNTVVETVVESDAIYTKKCKLFYKKGEAYVERGLGNIHLKKTDDSKLQVIIRADTTLGNILFNIIMTDQIPLERVGKNNVMVICVPNPPIDPKSEAEPVTFLIRVKTAEDADELKGKLTELAKTDV